MAIGKKGQNFLLAERAASWDSSMAVQRGSARMRAGGAAFKTPMGFNVSP